VRRRCRRRRRRPIEMQFSRNKAVIATNNDEVTSSIFLFFLKVSL
jgi:hypothetical protein